MLTLDQTHHQAVVFFHRMKISPMRMRLATIRRFIHPRNINIRKRFAIGRHTQ